MYPGIAAGDGEATANEPQDAVIYELDAGEAHESDAAAPSAPGAGDSPGAPAGAVDPRDARIAQLEQSHAAITAQLTPLVTGLQAQRQLDSNRPPIDPSRIDTDPNIKPSDLLALLEWKLQQGQQQTLTQAQYAARATLSEQTARGVFNEQALGAGNDYDTMVNRYVAPLVAQNPYLDTLIAHVFPNDPAGGRMAVAALVAAVDRNGGDLVRGIKSFLTGTAAYQQGARETTDAIARGARAAATPVLPGATAGAGVQRQRIESAKQVWGMTPSQFDRMWDQAGH